MSNPPEPEPSVIAGERRHLTNLAYRLLGSLTEAEDAVQEGYARWYAMPRPQRAAIGSPGAWLTTVVSRICLDVLGSARVRRERYVGEWIPEPLPDRTEWPGRPQSATDPADRVTLDDSVHMAFLVVLESMTPAERVAFVLHDVFRYPFPEIARIVDRTPAACRQLAASARRRVTKAAAPATPSRQQAALLRDFKEAWQSSDIRALVTLLDPDATMAADGGGLVSTVRRTIEGSRDIAAYLMHIAALSPGLTLLQRTVNGRPGLVAQRGGVTVTVAAFHLTEGRITHIWAVRNPEKLHPWTTLTPTPAPPAADEAHSGAES
ncbi:RNA polymerase sigma-70 factor (ECF subfamily) [Streptomyces sp. Ag109_G2-6]|uniref:RNA polymerase sigma factor SigJ n=1 Tax=Streptomyces TaxID=1883 RepID=UPI0009A502DB|nr:MULTISPECIES: RNA polymerase sigma factor SigJ [Streptomyces]RPF29897.1 RNA polymerase sigma-70 factor (ECF subfamily) [Streptomyces sp. Ag109_G2-6]